MVNRSFLSDIDNKSNEVQNKNLSTYGINCMVNIILGEEKLDNYYNINYS